MDVSNVGLHQLVRVVRERDGKRRSLCEYGQNCRVAYSIAFHDPRRCDNLDDLANLALAVPNWSTITRAEVGLLVARGADVVWHAETVVGVLELDPQHGTTLASRPTRS